MLAPGSRKFYDNTWTLSATLAGRERVTPHGIVSVKENMELLEIAQLQELVFLIGICPALKPVFEPAAHRLAEAGEDVVLGSDVVLDVTHRRRREVPPHGHAAGNCQEEHGQKLPHGSDLAPSFERFAERNGIRVFEIPAHRQTTRDTGHRHPERF
jgi:hypothetical protein